VFKTKICESDMDDKRHCKKFGQHCSKAHGEDDLRQPKRPNKNDAYLIDEHANTNIDMTNSIFKLINGHKESETVENYPSNEYYDNNNNSPNN